MEFRIVYASNKSDTFVHEELHRYLREENKAYPDATRSKETRTLLWVSSFVKLN